MESPVSGVRPPRSGLTVFREALDHVEFVYLFSVVFGLGVVLAAALMSVSP